MAREIPTKIADRFGASDVESEPLYFLARYAHSAYGAGRSARWPAESSRMSPGEQFFTTFTPAVSALLVAALRRAYDTTCEHHVPDDGSTEQMFGFNLYGFAVHQLVHSAESSDGLIEVKSRQPTFRLAANGYEIACHRVGHQASEDILTCFPKNEGAVHKMHEVQLWLPQVDLQLEKARKLVLAHLGNDQDGFEAAYLCFPGSTAKQRITSWAHAHPLWVKDQNVSPTSAAASDRVPEERIEEATPRRRSKKDVGGGQGTD